MYCLFLSPIHTFCIALSCVKTAIEAYSLDMFAFVQFTPHFEERMSVVADCFSPRILQHFYFFSLFINKLFFFLSLSIVQIVLFLLLSALAQLSVYVNIICANIHAQHIRLQCQNCSLSLQVCGYKHTHIFIGKCMTQRSSVFNLQFIVFRTFILFLSGMGKVKRPIFNECRC